MICSELTVLLGILSDGFGPNYGGGFGRPRRGGGPRREREREREEKVHDSIIEERIQRERPCRTLFIRNIKASVVNLARWEFVHLSILDDEVLSIQIFLS